MSEGESLRLAHLVGGEDRSGLFTEMARRHDRDRFHVELVTLQAVETTFREALHEIAVPVRSVGAAGRATWPLAVYRLVRLLRRRDIQILHTHLFEPSLVGLVAGVTARVPLRVMTRHHSDYHLRRDARLPVEMDRLCTRMSHGVVAVSEHTRDVMVSSEGAPPEKVRVIANGLSPERVRPPPPDVLEPLRREMHPDGRLALLVPARLHPEKGHEHLFLALRILRDEGWKVRAFLAGSGAFREAYERRIRALDLVEEVWFLGHREDVVGLMAAADAVVVPSEAEAFGLVALEARAVGAPLIATTAGGLPEVVRDGVDGILVPPGDPVALASAIRKVLSEDELRARMGRPDPTVADRFSFERMIREYEAFYRDLWNAR